MTTRREARSIGVDPLPPHPKRGVRTRTGKRFFALALVAVVAASGGQLGSPPAFGAGAEVTTSPADSSTVASPGQVTITFAGPADPAGAVGTVFTSEHKATATGSMTRDPANPSALVLAVPDMAPGTYSVVWSVEKPEAASGFFAFNVDPAGAKPKTVTSPKAAFALKPVKHVIVSWLPWLTIMTFVGALILRFLVTAPGARGMAESSERENVLASTDRRLLRVAAVALAIFVPATVAELALSAGQSKRFAFDKIWSTLNADGAGHLWFARLLLTAVAAIVVLPTAMRALAPASRMVKAMRIGMVLGLLEMVARVAPSGIPANKPRTIFGDLFTLAHIVSAAVWIGGLVGLVALAVRKGVPTLERSRFWPSAIRRFSMTAMACVGVVTLSGLWLYWTHVGAISQLRSTLYGRSLLIKLVLVGVLLALGAFNHLWLKPRVEGMHAAHDGLRINSLVDRHFRGVVAVEVLLGVGVLFVVPYLSGSARNQVFQTKVADISQTKTAGAAVVKFTPSGLQPGLTNYDVTVSGVEAKSVEMGFFSSALSVPKRTVTAKALGNGQFRASGFFTPMVGDWSVDVAVDGRPPSEAFALPVTAKAKPLARAAAPKITASTWLFGIGASLFVALSLAGAAGMSRRLARRRLPELAWSRPSVVPMEEMVDS
jgi:putative copper export protein/methionine-rich copper-binding protein CopC